MKKIMTVSIAICLSAILFCGCSSENKESDNTQDSIALEVMFPLDMPDIDITIPDSYQVTSTESNSTVYVKDDASIIVNEDSLADSNTTLEQYVEYAISTYETYSDKVEVLSNESINAKDTDGTLLEFIYSLETENGIFSKYCMTAFFADGDKVYLVTCKADTDTYTSYREEFLNVVESVKIKQ